MTLMRSRTRVTGLQDKLFRTSTQSQTSEQLACDIHAVGRRRDGGTRYWCLRHKSDATAKYGKRSRACRAAHLKPATEEETLLLDVDAYPGGVAMWGAVPPVYDTSLRPVDRGIHVHARRTSNGLKEIDRTYRAVRIESRNGSETGLLVTELDAIYFMVSSIFGYEMREIRCPLCGFSHLDKDWFSVHPHQRHLCAGCGRHFRDDVRSVGNPISAFRTLFRRGTPKRKPSRKKLRIRQADYDGGIQIWGSNPAFLWTSNRTEEEGIHVHAYEGDAAEPAIDDTFVEVVIDDVQLDARMVRTFMAQSALPHVRERVIAVDCPSCDAPQFDTGDLAFTPTTQRSCGTCSRRFVAKNRLRKTIANPLPGVFSQMARLAPRSPRQYVLDLLPETL